MSSDTNALLMGENLSEMNLSLEDNLALLNANRARKVSASPGNIDFFYPQSVNDLGAMQREELADARYLRKWGAVRQRPPTEPTSGDDAAVECAPLLSFGFMSNYYDDRNGLYGLRSGPPRFFPADKGAVEDLVRRPVAGWKPGSNWGMLSNGVFRHMSAVDFLTLYGSSPAVSWRSDPELVGNKRAWESQAEQESEPKWRRVSPLGGGAAAASTPSQAMGHLPAAQDVRGGAEENALDFAQSSQKTSEDLQGLSKRVRGMERAHDEATKQDLVRKQYALSHSGISLGGCSFERARDKIRAAELAHIKMLLLADSCARHNPKLKEFTARGIASLGEDVSAYKNIALAISSCFSWTPTDVWLKYYGWRSGEGFGLSADGMKALNLNALNIYVRVETARVLLDQHAAECAEKCISKSEHELAVGRFIAEFMGFKLDVCGA